MLYLLFIFLSWCKYSVFFRKKVSHSYKKVSTSYVLGVYFLQVDTLFNDLFPLAMRFPGIYRKMVNPAFYPLWLHFQWFKYGRKAFKGKKVKR